MRPINWSKKVVEDYRERIIVDPDSPILAFKASRDRYTNLPNQSKYAGLPHLGSSQSEDAVTWNVFRSLQKARSLGIITNKLEIGQPRGILLWTLAPEIDGINADLQYVTGAMIRKFDGIFPGQITEPDVIMLGTTGVAVVECKLSEPKKAPSHLWEGGVDRVGRRLRVYEEKKPRLLKDGTTDAEVAPVYQVVRMAFYAMELGNYFGLESIVVSLANRRNWTVKVSKTGRSASDWWDIFIKMLGENSPRCESLFWQDLLQLIKNKSLETLSAYLSTHPCIQNNLSSP